ncbi:hypothetical protein DL764_010646 [Monosporascus ibericus]|uniref:DUF7907 domain-containing protein n=1 Tax=Monosporascus ibericus TaxID=155417 RepID=A0A4Q4SUU2_9PEZI|nr:hypothetical protein DL764_010646 [Monosporascus ibericus]
MLSKTLSLTLASAVSAVPLSSRQVPNYPVSSTSLGFKLVANVTGPAKDLTPSVNGRYFSTIHTGAGMNDAVLEVDGGRVFYLNGTASEIRYNEGHVLTDGGLYSWGIYVQGEDETGREGKHEVTVNVGSGTQGVGITRHPEPYAYLSWPAVGAFAACNQFEPYYQKNYTTIRFAYDEWNDETALPERDIPEGCVAIRLIPECATLEELPEGSQASHEFSQPTRCYDDVSAIDWTQYGP